VPVRLVILTEVPRTPVAGVLVEMVGAGLLTVKVSVPDVFPSGLVTRIFHVPGAAPSRLKEQVI
jgi:hypothetical protein